MIWNFLNTYNDRVRRSTRGIVLAIALTIAAAASLVAAIERSTRDTSQVVDTVPAPAKRAN